MVAMMRLPFLLLLCTFEVRPNGRAIGVLLAQCQADARDDSAENDPPESPDQGDNCEVRRCEGQGLEAEMDPHHQDGPDERGNSEEGAGSSSPDMLDNVDAGSMNDTPDAISLSRATAGQYHFHLHVETSADEAENVTRERLHPFFVEHMRVDTVPANHESNTTSTSSASGMATPEPPSCDVDVLADYVDNFLQVAVLQGSDLVAQMLAQEILRLRDEHHEPRVRQVFHMISDVAQKYCVPGFEVGIVLDAYHGRWLADLVSRANRATTNSGRRRPGCS